MGDTNSAGEEERNGVIVLHEYLLGFRSTTGSDPISQKSLQPTADYILQKIPVGGFY